LLHQVSFSWHFSPPDKELLEILGVLFRCRVSVKKKKGGIALAPGGVLLAGKRKLLN
jgi:hypothetical protein